MTQLLLIEMFLKLAAGALLISAPLVAARVLGLQRPQSGFWPRVAGGLLLGMAAATFIEMRLPGSQGLGLYGIVAINLIMAGTLMGLLIMDAGAPTRRGRAVLWLSIGLLTLLALGEIAQN